jgi:ATP-dependent DNA helicase RecQ
MPADELRGPGAVAVDDAAVERLARDRLGFEQLRPGQLRAAAAAAAGRDVLAVLPTGGGKSAIYELAGGSRQAASTGGRPSLGCHHLFTGTTGNRHTEPYRGRARFFARRLG